jgi:hypothetical protein
LLLQLWQHAVVADTLKLANSPQGGASIVDVTSGMFLGCFLRKADMLFSLPWVFYFGFGIDMSRKASGGW